jgi:HPt (histidine-containing phosphotransfer) domain-containing protein
VGVTEPGESREDRSRELLRQIWIRNRPTTLERLEVVGLALEALASGDLDAARRDAALSEAHKLRGILGTYGFADGSELAAEAEELLAGAGAGAGGGAGEVSVRLAAFTRSLPEA